MQPGLARAVPLGILGFTIGAILARLIRLAQGLEFNTAEPNGFIGPAMVMGAFFAAGFFVWGMGAFDPKMNVHGDHAEEHPEEEKLEKPINILANFTWKIFLWVILLVLAVGAFAFLPAGPYLQSVAGDGDPAAINHTTVGQIYNPIREFADNAAGVQLPLMDEGTAGDDGDEDDRNDGRNNAENDEPRFLRIVETQLRESRTDNDDRRRARQHPEKRAGDVSL